MMYVSLAPFTTNTGRQALPMLGKVSLAVFSTSDSSAPLLCLHAVVL